MNINIGDLLKKQRAVYYITDNKPYKTCFIAYYFDKYGAFVYKKAFKTTWKFFEGMEKKYEVFEIKKV